MIFFFLVILFGEVFWVIWRPLMTFVPGEEVGFTGAWDRWWLAEPWAGGVGVSQTRTMVEMGQGRP